MIVLVFFNSFRVIVILNVVKDLSKSSRKAILNQNNTIRESNHFF